MSVKTENINIEDLLNKVKEYDDNIEDINLIRKAYEYAYKKHFSQKRITGDDYITHPLNVAWILTDVNADAEAISAALLHDTIEDSDSTYDEIKEQVKILICVSALQKISHDIFSLVKLIPIVPNCLLSCVVYAISSLVGFSFNPPFNFGL